MTPSQRKWLLLLRRVGEDGVFPAHKASAFVTKKACETRGWSETVPGKFGYAIVRITDAGRRALSEQEAG